MFIGAEHILLSLHHGQPLLCKFRKTNILCATLFVFFCRGYLAVVLTQNNWFCFYYFLFCKVKKSSVFLGITLFAALSTSPTDLPFTFTHTHTPVTPICIRIRIRHVIIFVFPMQRERDSLMMMMNVAQEFANLGQLG